MNGNEFDISCLFLKILNVCSMLEYEPVVVHFICHLTFSSNLNNSFYFAGYWQPVFIFESCKKLTIIKNLLYNLFLI